MELFHWFLVWYFWLVYSNAVSSFLFSLSFFCRFSCSVFVNVYGGDVIIGIVVCFLSLFYSLILVLLAQLRRFLFWFPCLLFFVFGLSLCVKGVAGVFISVACTVMYGCLSCWLSSLLSLGLIVVQATAFCLFGVFHCVIFVGLVCCLFRCFFLSCWSFSLFCCCCHVRCLCVFCCSCVVLLCVV
jgi:hypothetical protein